MHNSHLNKQVKNCIKLREIESKVLSLLSEPHPPCSIQKPHTTRLLTLSLLPCLSFACLSGRSSFSLIFDDHCRQKLQGSAKDRLQGCVNSVPRPNAARMRAIPRNLRILLLPNLGQELDSSTYFSKFGIQPLVQTSKEKKTVSCKDLRPSEPNEHIAALATDRFQ